VCKNNEALYGKYRIKVGFNNYARVTYFSYTIKGMGYGLNEW